VCVSIELRGEVPWQQFLNAVFVLSWQYKIVQGFCSWQRRRTFDATPIGGSLGNT
jgi:hypothetical protein